MKHSGLRMNYHLQSKLLFIRENGEQENEKKYLRFCPAYIIRVELRTYSEKYIFAEQSGAHLSRVQHLYFAGRILLTGTESTAQ